MKVTMGKILVSLLFFSGVASVPSVFAMKDESPPIDRHARDRENKTMIAPNVDSPVVAQFDSELRRLEIQVGNLKNLRNSESRASSRYQLLDGDVKELEAKLQVARQSLGQYQVANQDSKDMYRAVVESELAEIRYSLNKYMAE